MRRAQQRAEIALEKTVREREIEEAEIRAPRRDRKIAPCAGTGGRHRTRPARAGTWSGWRSSVRRSGRSKSMTASSPSPTSPGSSRTPRREAETARARMVEAQEHVASRCARRRSPNGGSASSSSTRRSRRSAKRSNSGPSPTAEKKAAIEQAEAEESTADAPGCRYEVDAEGKRQLNEAENLRSDASRRSALHRASSSRTSRRSFAKASSRSKDIESIKILQVDGMPGLSGVHPAAAADGRDGGRARRATGPTANPPSLADSASTPRCAIARRRLSSTRCSTRSASRPIR